MFALIFAFLLLLSNAAWADTGTSAAVAIPVAITGSGSQIACDVGPAYTAPLPVVAIQAGMTRCAANYDFTVTGAFTDSVGTHQWSDLSSWFDCTGNVTSPHLVHYQNVAIGGGRTPCDTNHQYVTTINGVQAFVLSFSGADSAAGNSQNSVTVINTALSGDNVDTLPNNINPYRQEMYVESTLRFSDTSVGCTDFCTLFDYSTFHANGNNPCFMAIDQEYDSGASGSGVGFAQWNPMCGTSGGFNGTCANFPCASPVNCPTTTAITTRGTLITGDGISQYASNDYCVSGLVYGLPGSSWLSALPQTAVPPASSAQTFDTPVFFYWNSGSTNWATSDPTYTTTIYRITVWQCPNYLTQTCINNPVITSAP